jgi:amino acid transporter
MKKISNIIITIAALCLLAFSFIFQCAPKDDGLYMNCHKANLAIAAISFAIIILSILLFILKNKVSKQVIYVLTAISSIVCGIIPGILIHLCMMPEMTCRAIFRPTDIICSIIIFLFSIVGFIFSKKEKS